MNQDLINEHYHGDPSDPATERARERIHWICSQANGQDVLDLGCSQGIVCLILGREGFHCTGVDIESAPIAIARQALAKEEEIVRQRVSFQVADAALLPFANECFDTVVLGEIIEHLTHPVRVLSHAQRVLRNGGRLVVTVPYGLNAYPDHKRTFYPISLLELLQPLFRTATIGTLGNYIFYTGIKDPAYAPQQVSKETLFEEYLPLEKALEERCLSKERSLLETATKLYAQIKNLSARSADQANKLRELGDGIALRDKRARELEAGVEPAQTLISELRERAIRSETEAIAQANRIKEHQEGVAAKDNRIRELENAAEQKWASFTELGQRTIRAEAKSTAQASRSKELERRLAAKERQIQSLEKNLKQERNSTTALRKSLTLAESGQAGLSAEAASAKNQIAVLEQRLATLELQGDQLKQDLAAKSVSSQRQLAQMEALQAASVRDAEKRQGDLLARRDADWKRKWSNQRVREIVRVALPPQARALVISKGDDDLLGLDGRNGSHFPQAAGGVYAGYHPANSAEAIGHLEALKAKGAEFLVVPASSFWWLDFYKDFSQHLESTYRLLVYSEDCVIFALALLPESRSRFRLAVERAPVSGPESIVEQKSGVQTKPLAAISNPAPQNGSASPPNPSARNLASAPAPSATESRLPSTPIEARPVARVSVPDPQPSQASAGLPAVGCADASRQPGPKMLTLACILDEFTAACFNPECKLVTFRPDNWKSILDRTPVDALFIESAWHGNGGSWQYKIASFKKPMGEELVDVVNYCKERKVPTVFWNKEDPSHFDRFIHRAQLFDYVFTSDADMIPKYRDVLKHDRIFALPFAAQPKLHNPIMETDRLHNVCFAGAYYALDHDSRRADMDHLLLPALSYGLHIYDRQYGVVGTNAKAFQFPEVYQPAIKGRLEYDQMVNAYKWYKIFLNVNSVKQSPTMFSRRVFELLASGTPVISSYSKGIVGLLGTEIVHIAQSAEETKNHLERLLKDDEYWAQITLKGIREVMSRHTYAHRLAEICRKVGLTPNPVPQPKIAAFALVDADQIDGLTALLAAQTYRNFNLTVIPANTLAKARLDGIQDKLPGIEVRFLPQLTRLPELLLQAAEGSYVWLINLEDYYGCNFLKDAALTTVYSDAEVIGKHTYLESDFGAEPRLMLPGHEFRFVKSVSPGSIIAKAGKLDAIQWRALAGNRTPDLSNLRVLSIDRFNYIKHGGKIAGYHRPGAQNPLAAAFV